MGVFTKTYPSVALNWYHWLVILSSTILTLGAYYITKNQVTLKSEEQFRYQSQQILDLVEERMIKYEEALWAGVAALQMFQGNATRADWKVFADVLKVDERFPGINGIGVIHYVPPDKLSNYLSWQRETMSDYNIHPRHELAEYWPITYIEPQQINAKAVGLDMAHEANRFTGAKAARDTKKATITGPITLVQDSKQTPGFLFYAPWYSATHDSPFFGETDGKFNALVYAPFMMYKLMDGTLENVNRLVNFSIHDEGSLLYSELDDQSSNIDEKPMFFTEETLILYGRTWTFNMQSTLLFREQQSHAQPFIILAGGLTIDALLLIIFMVLANSTRNAVIYAERITKDLKKRKEELETVSQNLEVRNRELVEANAELDQFAFVASHDLKAPLRGIHQLAQWIEEDSEGSLSEVTRNYLDLLKSRISRLEKLLDDLLTYSRVGRKEGNIERISVEALINDVFLMLNHENKFTLSTEISSGPVNTLTTPLEQIIRNLFSNTMKHHDKESGQIDVAIYASKDHLHITVQDDGPGIPEAHQTRVFDLFHRLRPRDQVEGSGLGLSIIKKILERYGCEYSLTSNGERGLAFYFTWPIESHETELLAETDDV